MLNQITENFKVQQKDLFNSERIIFADYLDGIDVEQRIYK